MTKSYNPTYRAKVSKTGGWPAFKICRQHISVGQEYHEGEKLKATVAWAMAQQFERHVIVIADTLQRHNLPGGHSEQNRDHAQREGDSWLARNFKTISALPSLMIIRWDGLLLDEDFDAYYNHPAFKKISSDYIREEAAAFALLHNRQPAADIYPGSFRLPLINDDVSFNKIKFIKRGIQEFSMAA